MDTGGTAAVAYPPVVGKNKDVFGYVAEGAGFECIRFDEPTATNGSEVDDGAIVDIGGGTTGWLLKMGKLFIRRPAYRGTHFLLVIAGAYKIPFEEARNAKDPSLQRNCFLWLSRLWKNLTHHRKE